MNKIKEWLYILKKLKYYRYWRLKVAGHRFADFERGAGFYIGLDKPGKPRLGQKWLAKISGNRTGVYMLVAAEMYEDPSDMVKLSKWDFEGYVGSIPINMCTFREFIEIYNPRPKGK